MHNGLNDSDVHAAYDAAMGFNRITVPRSDPFCVASRSFDRWIYEQMKKDLERRRENQLVRVEPRAGGIP